MQKTSEHITYSAVTNDIKITVLPEFIEEQTIDNENLFAFSYNISIENMGTRVVQLLKRHWLVYSSGHLFSEVKGDGVVGEQPILVEDSIFKYASGAIIKDPVGSMEGTYQFLVIDSPNQEEIGNLFEVAIPKFDLVCPDYIH